MTNYTYPLPTNVTRIEHLLSYANGVTDSFFGTMMLITIFVIAFVSMKYYKTNLAFAGASFITAMSSYLFFILGLVSETAVLVSTFILVIAVIFLGKSD